MAAKITERHVSIFYYGNGHYSISITPINPKTGKLRQRKARFYKPGEKSLERLTLLTWFNHINLAVHLGATPSIWFRWTKKK
jgi:hypothetical protein